MLYRIRVDMAFTTRKEMNVVRTIMKPILATTVTIHPGKDNEERSYIDTEKCFHDQHPILPCIALSQDVAW